MASYPLLKAHIVDARTTKPKWGILSDALVDAGLNALVRDVRLENVMDPRLAASEKGGSVLSPSLPRSCKTNNPFALARTI